MTDDGRLYSGFDNDYVEAMKLLCKRADILLPNMTEACLVSDMPYPEKLTHEYALKLSEKLAEKYKSDIALTEVPFSDNKTGVIIVSNGAEDYYMHNKVHESFPGTGDVFSSVFVGAYLNGKKNQRSREDYR